jgi:Flp pilus assembly protein TadG
MRKLHRSHDRRGNAVYTAITMLTLLGFGALTVDIGRDRVAQAEVQNAADAGAHAAVRVMTPSNTATFANAKLAGAAVANSTYVLGEQFGTRTDAFTSANFEIGTYSAGTFTVTNTNPNAVRVSNKQVTVSMLFGSAAFMSANTTLTASASAIAMAPSGIASHVACPLPFAVPDCYFNGSGAAHSQTWTIQSATVDDIAWATPAGVTGAAAIRNLLTGTNCYDGASIGEDMVDLNNGMINSAYTDLRDLMAGSTVNGVTLSDTQVWDTGNWGTAPTTTAAGSPFATDTTRFVGGSGHYGTGALYQGPIMLFNSGSDGYTCPTSGSAHWNETRDITGFAWAVVYDTGGTTGSGRGISMTLDFSGTHAAGDDTSTTSNGVDGGITALQPPVIVQ